LRRSLLFNATVYVIGQFATKILGFVLLVVYARCLQPADFGVTGTLGAYGMVLAAVFVLGLNGAVSRHYFDLRRDPDALRSYMASVYAFQLAVSLLIVLALELAGPALWRAATSGAIVFSDVRLMLWATLFTALIAIPQAFWQAEERPTVLVASQLAQTVLGLVAGVVFVAALEQGATGVMRGQLVAAIALALVVVGVFVREIASRDLRWSHVRGALVYGLPLLPHILGTILMQTVDRIMLERYAPQTEVGLYSIAMLLATVLAMAAGGINQAWAPHFFRTSSEESPEVARAKAETFASLFVALFTGLGLFGALLAPELLHILGEPYLPVAPYLVPWVIGTLFGIYYLLPANQLLLGGQTRWFVIATGSATVLSIALNAYFLPRGGGGMAAAWIFVAGTACQTGVILVAALMRHRSLLGARHAVGIAISIAALVLASRGPSLPVRIALLVGASAALYVLLVRGKLREVWPQR